MGYGYGYPLFNYYSALPYYIGGLLSFILGFVNASKALFFIFLIVGGVSMYLLGKSLWGEKAGLAAGVLYIFAPYRALDAYVRGALAESYALALIPLVFYFLHKLIKEPNKKNFIGTSLSLGAFLLSHNIMTMIFMPIIISWIIFWWAKERPKKLGLIILSFALGIGFSAFFLLPAFFEKGLVQTESLTSEGFQYWIHFVSLYQLFLDRSWGFGASIFGMGDTISFQIGWPHWWVVGLALVLLVYKAKSKKFLSNINFQIGIFFLLFFLLSIFMTHNKSTFIWSLINTLQFAQFPWRFLGLTVFTASLLGGFLIYLLSGNIQKYLLGAIIVLCLIFNFSYFEPADIYPDADDHKKLSGNDWDFQRKASLKDYLPKTATEPMTPAPQTPVVGSGDASVSNFVNRSNKWEFEIVVNELSEVEVPVFEFPNWQVYANGNKLEHSHTKQGNIKFNLDEGDYRISGVFKNTPIRVLANAITILSFICLITFLTKNKLTKKLWT